MKNIFLSASIPLPDRHAKYYKTADIIAIRDAVIALTSIAIPDHRIIWGGHPSITPLIYYVIERILVNNLKREDWSVELTAYEQQEIQETLKQKIQEHVVIYQSLFFQDRLPSDNRRFNNIVFTENTGDLSSSLNLMRTRMIKDTNFSAAVFIGGMEGINIEYDMFRRHHPEALIIPLASTGAATKILYTDLLPNELKNERFLRDYGYFSLFQKLLVEKI